MTQPLDIVGLCGSLRKGSLNRMALQLAGELMPPSMKLDIVDWRELPPFDADVLAAGMPAPVRTLRERIAKAHGVLFATPEYNFGLPGMLKNAIDWASRGADQPFAMKPVAVLSATPGPLGGARVQYELRKALQYLHAMVMVKPEVFIGMAEGKFDAQGRCTDETTRKFVAEQMRAFELWIAAVRRMNAG